MLKVPERYSFGRVIVVDYLTQIALTCQSNADINSTRAITIRIKTNNLFRTYVVIILVRSNEFVIFFGTEVISIRFVLRTED